MITVSSNMEALGRIDFSDLQGERSYSGARAYNQSKIANVRFTYELARRLTAASVTANALHPGVTRTAFGGEDPATARRLFVPFMRPLMKTPAQGATTSIYLASAPGLEQASGRYFASSKPGKSAKRSYDETAAARLWQVSADLTAGSSAQAATIKPRRTSAVIATLLLGGIDQPTWPASDGPGTPVRCRRGRQ